MPQRNAVAHVKVQEVAGPAGRAVAMMIALDVYDPASADAFVDQVIERFKLERTAAPMNTSLLLITIMGDLPAQHLADRWRAAALDDPILGVYMSTMQLADAIQGGPKGEVISKASLIGPPPPRPGASGGTF